MGLCNYLLNEWMHRSLIGLLFYSIVAETSGRREESLMGGRQTWNEEGEKSVWRMGQSVSGRLGLGGALKWRPRVAEHSVALDRWGKKPWKKGNAMRQCLEQWLINFGEPPKCPGSLRRPLTTALPPPCPSEAAGPEWNLSVCISNFFPSASDAAGNLPCGALGLLVSGVRTFGVWTRAVHLATCGTVTVYLASGSQVPSHVK